MADLPTKLLIFTDLHLVNEGCDIIGLNPAERFREGLDHALQNHPDAARLVLMGDLTHEGRTAQYQQLAQLLEDVPIPITFLMGNHDNRDVFRTIFPQAEATSAGHIQQMVDLGDACLIALDTLNPKAQPQHSGTLCEDRLGWLENALAWANGKPVVLAMHHPPIETGFVGMDLIKLQNPAPLLAMLNAYQGEVHVLCGHIHRTISGRAGGVSFTCFKSTCDQQPMPLEPPESSHSVDEPGAYGIVLCGRGGIIAHTEDFAVAAAAANQIRGAS